jgi:heat shock protein HtpX
MWEQIRSNKRRSAFLVVIMAALLFFLGYALGEYFSPGGGAIGLGVAFLVWVILALVGYYQGGNIMLAVSGAREIKRDDLPMLYNVVEEMKIASGLSQMPRIFLVDDPAPNAFATGRDPNHAAVAVTSGLLERLDRDELQGVIGHEIAHIQNRDILLMIMAGVMLGTIVLLADVGVRAMYFGGGRRSRSSSDGGQLQILMMLVALVLVILAPIVAQLLYFAFSRRREYLADAGGAQYTRYPEGLASALEKISSAPVKLARANRATSPMYIVNPLQSIGAKAAGLTSTHPPVAERIKVLRGMAGGASYLDYERSFREVRGSDAGVIPPRALRNVQKVDVRGPTVAAVTPAEKEERVGKKRQVQDAVWKANNYRVIPCSCGATLKVPPTYKLPELECPRCGLVHNVDEARELSI